jgi:hypothetical protein
VKLPCVEATGAASDAKCHSAVFDLFVPTAPMLSVIGHSYQQLHHREKIKRIG